LDAFLIVGLGNPGPRYETTRHNVGFLLLDELAEKAGVSSWEKKFHGEFSRGRLLGESVYFLKPLTMMNLSGQSVQACMAFFKCPITQLIVISDDIDQDSGNVRLRTGGGHGGQNGLRDIIQRLGGADFHRIKVGVGRPEIPQMQVADFLLSSMPDSQLLSLQNHVLDDVVLRLSELFKRQKK
jgi:peptidyl-tRNA hydrolase, PTH1 family